MKWLVVIFLFIGISVHAQDEPLVRLEGSPKPNLTTTIIYKVLLNDTVNILVDDSLRYSGVKSRDGKEIVISNSNNLSRKLQVMLLHSTHGFETIMKQGYRYLYISKEKGRWFLNYSNEKQKGE